MHGVSELQPVHAAGHLDVGEQQRDVRARFKNGKRFVGVDGFDRRKPGVLDDVDRAHAQHHLVFHDKNVGCRFDRNR